MMNYCAYEILMIIDDYESIDHPEMIPSPQRVREDKEFSEALDWLLEQGYVKICKARYSTHHDVQVGIGLGFFNPDSDSLTITASGIEALEHEGPR
jgi:hypothetical protein